MFLPSENEWYKAAYYNPATSSYFQYPTSSNTVPTATGPTATPISANYNHAVGNLTPVGAYSGTTSPYGAYDLGGNVFQWNETLISGSFRGLRGGEFGGNSNIMQSSYQGFLDPTYEFSWSGFRVASVPEPGSIALAAVGLTGLVAYGWRRRRALRHTMPVCSWLHS